MLSTVWTLITNGFPLKKEPESDWNKGDAEEGKETSSPLIAELHSRILVGAREIWVVEHTLVYICRATE